MPEGGFVWTHFKNCVFTSLNSFTYQCTFSKKNSKSIPYAYLQYNLYLLITNSTRVLFAVHPDLINAGITCLRSRGNHLELMARGMRIRAASCPCVMPCERQQISHAECHICRRTLRPESLGQPLHLSPPSPRRTCWGLPVPRVPQ